MSAATTAYADSPSTVKPPILKFIDEQGIAHELTQSDFTKLPRSTAKVVNHGGKPAEYEGVALGPFLESQGVKLGKGLRGKRLAEYLLFEATDGYRVVLALAEADPSTSSKTVLLADEKNGQPLPKNEGPWRLILPDEKRPARWIRMIKQIAIESALAADKPKQSR